jgi:hypothetical protein
MAKKSNHGVSSYTPVPKTKRRGKLSPLNHTKRLNKRSPDAGSLSRKRGQG